MLMRKVLLALSLALTFLPVAALADDANPPGPPAVTPQQRQAMFNTFETFRRQEDQLHQQMRAQILGSLSAAHRTAVADLIGRLAITANPDPAAAAKQLDAILSQREQQQILAAHNAFRERSKTLHEQMRAQLEKQLPAGGPGPFGGEHTGGPMGMQGQRPSASFDAGTVLLMSLSPHPMREQHLMLRR